MRKLVQVKKGVRIRISAEYETCVEEKKTNMYDVEFICIPRQFIKEEVHLEKMHIWRNGPEVWLE
jgi:hypothetical protein